jgi:hypothetical protein
MMLVRAAQRSATCAMSYRSLDLPYSDFEPLPERPLRSPRFWLGKAVAVPLWLALAIAYLLISPD